MPKQKTHSAAKKRFKVTGAGKLLRRQAMKRKRKFRRDQPLHKSDVRAVKRLLGGVKKG